MTADRDREAFIAELERQHRDIEDHGDGTVTMIAGCTPRSSSFVLNVDDLIASVVPAALAPAQEPVAVPDGGLTERVAKVLWKRFAPEHHMEWEGETHKAEYRCVAGDVLAMLAAPAVPGWKLVPIDATD
jgi:hypothetical protein